MKYSKLVILVILLFSCSKDDPEETLLSAEKSLFSFSIKELPALVFSGFQNKALTSQLEQREDITNLTAVFNVSPKAKVLMNGVLQKSGNTLNNFNQTVTYTIIAEDETAVDFTVTINTIPNQDPTANAGEDQVVYIAVDKTSEIITLDASNSTDPEGDALEYEWKIDDTVIGTSEILETELDLGIHTIGLRVKDAYGGFDETSIQIDLRMTGRYYPINENASEETRNVLNNIATLALSDKFAFGQEFPLSFQLNELDYDLTTSDCKDVSGDHPAVFGIDPHYMLYKSASERQLHIDEAKAAYANGAIVTFDFHQRSRIDGEINFNRITSTTDKSLLYDIVNDQNGSRSWYFNEIDEVLSIINNDLNFTVIFRLFHEMNGSWFWWGTQTENHSPALYVDFYRLTVDYIKQRTEHVLFAWSPDKVIDESYYPGDVYVDVVGLDYYRPSKNELKQSLIDLTLFAERHNKVAALTETGQQQYHSNNMDFWTDNILSVIEEGGQDIKIAWVLAWFNAPWDSGLDNLFIPNSQSPQDVKDDFIQFKNSRKTLFMNDVQALDLYGKQNSSFIN